MPDQMRETPDFDRLWAEFGHRFDESPWSPEVLEAPNFKGLPKDYELPPLPLHMMLSVQTARVNALTTQTQTMEIINVSAA